MNKQILPLTQQAKQAITIKRLVTKLRQARTNYYNSGELLLTDNNFDDLEDKLRALAPHHSYFKTVGINFDSSGEAGKVKHLVPMLSADKAKDMTEVSKWLGKLKLASYQLIIEPKIDGLSASCRYVNGLLDVVATRGDGRTGQDITEVAGYISAIPKKLSQPLTIEVRGELYLPRNTSYDTKGKPLRNNTVGLINRKENKAEASFVHFAAYRIEGYSYGTEEEAIKLITALGFSSVPYQLVSSEEEIDNYYQQYLEQLRDQWVYETDGLMLVINNSRLQAELDRRWVVDHHHHYALAFKPPSASKVSSLINVEWQVSRSGFAIPVAIFAPIQLGGATLERASLHNAEYVGKLKLAAGDQLLIERANDVIPYVRDNLSGHGREDFMSNFLIKNCPSCQSKLAENGVHLQCVNNNCPEVNIQKILYWVKSSGMENIAEATIRKLYEVGLVKAIKDLYSVKASDLFLLEGFGDKKTENFFNELKKSRNLTISSFISYLGIRLVGKKAVKKLAITTKEAFWHFDDNRYVIGRNLIAWRDDAANKLLVSELLSVLNVTDEEAVLIATLGEVCLTGKGPLPRSQLEAKLAEMGYTAVSSVSKYTVKLVCDDVNAGSSKLNKARSLGIPIVTYQDFFSL